MSNASDIIAALCAKAADVAFASKISEAATTFKMLEPVDGESEVKVTTVKMLCSKASAFNADDLLSKPLHPSQKQEHAIVDVDAPTMATGGSGGQAQHPISKMDLQEILSLTKSFVTIPSGGRTQTMVDPNLPPPLPTNIITRRSSISSTTSSLTDLDHVRPLDPAGGAANVLETLKLDDLIHALRKKVSESPRQGNLTNEAVVALANALCDTQDDLLPAVRRNSCIATQNNVTKEVVPKVNSRRRDASNPALKRHGSNPRRGRCRSNSLSLEVDNPKSGQYNRTNLPVTTTKGPCRVALSGSPHAVVDTSSSQLRRSSACSKSTASNTSGERSHIPDDDELLARGWKKALDAATGQYYYYTLDRSKVVWNNPLVRRVAFAQEDEQFTMPGDQDFFMNDSFDNHIDFSADNTNPFKVVYSGSQRKS